MNKFKQGVNIMLKPYLDKHVDVVIDIKNDNEQKLVVCKEKDKYSKEHILALVEFQEIFFDSDIIIQVNKI